MAEYLTNDTDLKKVANAIRAKGETSANLSYPDGFVSAIQNIPKKVVLLASDVTIADGVISFSVDKKSYDSGLCDFMVVVLKDSPKYKGFIYTYTRQIYYATHASSAIDSIGAGFVTVDTTTSTRIVFIDYNASDSSGTMYTGTVDIYGWNS